MAASCVDIALGKVLQVFGVESLKIHQRKILDCVLSGKDCMAVLPTRYGKSLPFQLYPLVKNELDGTAPKVIVCTPLIALMKDQVKKLSAIPGLRAGYKGMQNISFY
jgi:ATP-dependent DNA helicase RecQ